MEDKDLEKYFPKFGDRLAVKTFSLQHISKTEIPPEREGSIKSLMERVRAKVTNRGSDKGMSSSNSRIGNHSALKDTRRIEVGWLHGKGGESHQVRARRGGGVRHLKCTKSMTAGDIKESAIALFFPDGTSNFGNITQFETKVMDFANNVVDETLTIGEIYEKTKVKLLRLYLSTKSLDSEVTDTKPDTTARQSKKRKATCTAFESKEEAIHVDEENGAIDESSSSCEQVLPAWNKVNLSMDDEINFGLTPGADIDLSDTLPLTGSKASCEVLEKALSEKSQLSPFFAGLPLHSSSPVPPQAKPRPPDIQVQCPEAIHRSSSTLQRCLTSEGSLPSSESANVSLSSVQEFTNAHLSSSTECAQASGGQTVSTVDSQTYFETNPRSPTPPPESTSLKVTATLHTVNIQSEMVAIFIDPNIVDTPLAFKFVDESGEDADGVSREAYSRFWKEFSLTTMTGETERIPALFPEFGEVEWASIGRILAKGYIDLGIFPANLSRAFAVALINGMEAVTPEILLQSFFAYICESDRAVITKALEGNLTDEDDKDDLLDILSRVECRSIPAPDQLKPSLIRIAHKEKLQGSKYALDQMSSTAGMRLRSKLPSAQHTITMINDITATTRKVLKSLCSTPICKEEEVCYSYLKQYIKSLDQAGLRKFLRFVTGAEVMCCDKITIDYNNTKGTGRTPIARTCGPLLELPTTYSSYNDLRADFTNILESGYLKMDII